jgi:hypothetical protein
MFGPTANNHFDVCNPVGSNCIGIALKKKTIYANLLELPTSRMRETPSSVILMLQVCEESTANAKSTTSSQGILWENVFSQLTSTEHFFAVTLRQDKHEQSHVPQTYGRIL